MHEEKDIALTKSDVAFERVTRLPVQDRALEAARRGLERPETLSREDMKLVCRTLIFQYAQMGIG